MTSDLRRETKKLMNRKKKDYAYKLRDSLSEKPKRFWFLVKASTTQMSSPSIVHDCQKIITDKECRANLLNSFLRSVFSEATSNSPADTAQPLTNQRLSNIRLSESEVTALAALENLDSAKAFGMTKSQDDFLKLRGKKSLQASANSLTCHFNSVLCQEIRKWQTSRIWQDIL